MKLSVKDRMIMPRLFPQRTNLKTQIIIRGIMDKVHLTKEELDKLETTKDGRNIVWKQENDFEIDITFTREELDFLQGQVALVDEKNQVTLETLDICLKIQNEN